MVSYIKSDKQVVEENNLHYLPCQIGYNGKAKVSTYFDSSTECDEEKKSSFRGRPLHGQEIKIPEGYCGYILKKPSSSFPSQEKIYEVEQSFTKFTFWNLDKTPSTNDTLTSALDWLDVSKALHSKSTRKSNDELINADYEE